jgi:hypothetical protein
MLSLRAESTALTGVQGTFMYAAPEVLMGQPSNEKVRPVFLARIVVRGQGQDMVRGHSHGHCQTHGQPHRWV